MKPLDRLARTETGEGSNEGTATTRIALGKLAGIKAGVGDIAPPASGNPDLRQHMAGFFQNRHTRAGIGLRRGDGPEKARRPAAHDHNLSGNAHARMLRNRRPLAIPETKRSRGHPTPWDSIEAIGRGGHRLRHQLRGYPTRCKRGLHPALAQEPPLEFLLRRCWIIPISEEVVQAIENIPESAITAVMEFEAPGRMSFP